MTPRPQDLYPASGRLRLASTPKTAASQLCLLDRSRRGRVSARRARRLGVWCLQALTAGALATGCGAPTPPSVSLTPAQTRAALRGSPPPLVAVHAQANRLLGGGVDAFKRRLRELRGHPVVVNMWGSWCPPCRREFPVFQSAALKLGRHTAFLGVDTMDSAVAARAFLAKDPVSYPSYEDRAGTIVRFITPTFAIPITAFYKSAGTLGYLHLGPYISGTQLGRDVRRYAAGP